MIDLEFSFEPQPWQRKLQELQAGQMISAAELLTLLEAEDEIGVEEALNCLEQNKITLDVSGLPPLELRGAAALRLKQEAELTSVDRAVVGLDENDPLKLYLKELALTPAFGDPQELAERYLAGNYDVAEQLVNGSLGRVIETAMGYTGHGVLLMDLIQEGSLGLWQGILQFAGGDFLSHGDWWINQYMAKAVFLQARANGAGQKLRQDMEDYRDADQRLLMELGRNPTIQEIAEALHITVEACGILEKMVQNVQTMDRVKQEEEPEPTPDDDQAVEDTAYFQLRQRIAELLSGLSETDKKLLTLRFGLEGGKPLSPVETGAVLGLTPEQVVSREAAALSLLREQ